jgi:hypothetical protein
LWMILSFLQPLAGTLHFPNLNLCTSCHFRGWCHYFVLQIMEDFALPKVNICTSCFHTKLRGTAYTFWN